MLRLIGAVVVAIIVVALLGWALNRCDNDDRGRYSEPVSQVL